VSGQPRTGADVFYDADCRFCAAGARRFERVLTRRRFSLVPLQAADAAARLGVDQSHLLDEMRVRFEDGRVVGGAEAIMQIARRIWWAWPLWAFSRLPGVARPMDAAYKWFARNRGCVSGSCRR